MCFSACFQFQQHSNIPNYHSLAPIPSRAGTGMRPYSQPSTHLCVSLDLSCSEVFKHLRELGKVDVDELGFQIQTEQRKKVAFLNQNQLIVSL